jgi:hypothetical protein
MTYRNPYLDKSNIFFPSKYDKSRNKIPPKKPFGVKCARWVFFLCHDNVKIYQQIKWSSINVFS